MSTQADVIVVGAGPAGAAAAIQLARTGLRVIVLEKESLPRDKACGDGLIADSLAVLDRLGLRDRVEKVGQSSRAIRIYAPDSSFVDVPGKSVCVRREIFDAMLVAAAVEAGAVVRGACSAISFSADGREARVRVRDEEGDGLLRAKAVILACGAAAKVLERFGLPHRTRPSAIALRAYYRLREDVPQDLLRIWFERPILPGYAWLFPMGRHEFNIGVGTHYDRTLTGRTHLHDLLERFLTQCPSSRELMRSAQPLGRVIGAPLRTGLDGCSAIRDRLVVAGEALGTTYPFTGEGIGKAMETGLLAADVIASALKSGDLSERALTPYLEMLSTRLKPKYRHYAIAQRWVRFPWVVNYVARRARSSKRVLGALSAIVEERIDPSRLISLSGLAKAVFAK